MLLQWFKFARPSKKSAAPSANSAGYFAPQSARELLASEQRQHLLGQIWEQTSIPKDLYARLYLAPLHRYAECVQLLPASESHHHSYPGGMLDHGLELMLYALRLRQSYLLPPGAPPEEQAKQSDAWTAGSALGALLHDIGKIAVDIQVETANGKLWHPWQDNLNQLNKPYRFRYQQGRDYHLHNAAAGLLYAKLFGQEVMDWLSQTPLLWGSLLYLLAGDYERAGVLGEIVSKADRMSTALNVGANPQKALQAPPKSLQNQLLRGLKHLLTDEAERIKLNQEGAAGWLTQEGLWLVSKVVSDRLRAFLLTEGVDGVPTKNSALFDELQSHRLIEANGKNQAIWKATVTEGDWVQTFTFLKVKPSLIWGGREYPPVFAGTVAVACEQEAEGERAAPPKPTDKPQAILGGTQATAVTKMAVPVIRNTPAPRIVNDAPAVQGKPCANIEEKTPNDEGIDDLLALFEESTAAANSPVGIPPNSGQDALSTTRTTIGSAPNSHATSNPPPQLTPPSTFVQAPDNHHLRFTETPDRKALGEAFLHWLKQRIAAHKLLINHSAALIHLVDGKVLLVSPKLFERFCHEQPDLDRLKPKEELHTWRWVQKSFEALRCHYKHPDTDLNIWACPVKGPRKQGIVKGYLIEASVLFDNPPPDNPFISLPAGAAETV